MLTLKEWLAKYGQEDCNGCEYNQPTKAHCLYKGKNYCVRYERMARDLKGESEKQEYDHFRTNRTDRRLSIQRGRLPISS